MFCDSRIMELQQALLVGYSYRRTSSIPRKNTFSNQDQSTKVDKEGFDSKSVEDLMRISGGVIIVKILYTFSVPKTKDEWNKFNCVKCN